MSDAGASPKDFQDTLNLPRTEFPEAGDLARLELRLLAWWAERGISARVLEKQAGAAPFALADAPLYAAREPLELATLTRGLLSHRTEPVPWCLNEATALAEAEVEVAPRTGPSAYVAFRAGPEVAERFSSLKGREVSFVAWTREPWTLPALQALAVNGDAEYVFYDAGARVLCVAKELLARVLAEVKADELVMKNARLPGGEVETVAFDDLRKILVYASGEELEHLTYQHPFLERTGRVVLSGHVTLEAGTGLVPLAPAHGREDWEVGQRYGLEPSSPVRGDGRYDETAGARLQGLRVSEADPAILALLAERGALLNAKTDTVERGAPCCRHCRGPVIPRAMPQWFVALDAPLTGQGEELSGSQGRVIALRELLQQYGAEALRLWVASGDWREDVRLSERALQESSQGYATFRETLRYALGHLYDFDPARDAVPASELLPLDAWARGRLAEAVARVRRAYEASEFHVVCATLMDFCAADRSAVYFDILKDRLLTAKATGRARRSAQTVLYALASTLARLLAPVLSFTAEEAWQQLPGRPTESVFLAEFPQPGGVLESALAERYAKLFAVRGAVRGVMEEARREDRIGASLEARVVLTASGEARELLEANLGELPELFGASQVELVAQPGPTARPLAVAPAPGEGAALTAEVLPARGARCPRCQHYAEEVEQGSEVCPRCREALS